MNVLFFSVRHHHQNYFRKLSEQANQSQQYQATLVRHRHWWLRNPWPLFRNHPELDDVVLLKLKEKCQDTNDYHLPAHTRWINQLWLGLFSRFLYRAYYNGLRRQQPDVVVTWGGLMWHQRLFVLAARAQGIKTLLMENGPLPATTTIDPKGVNFINSLPRQLDALPLVTSTDRPLPASLVPRHSNRHKPSQDAPSADTPLPKRYIFVPFQVDADRQILCFSPWLANMRDFYRALELGVEHLPDDVQIVIKEHPSCPKHYADLHTRHSRIHFANSHNTQKLIEQAELVITINSSVGLEAMLLEKPVAVAGQAFYNLPELCQSATSQAELNHILSNPNLWQPSTEGRRYLGYLYNEYLVKGSWKQAEPDHIAAMNQRIVELSQ
ncbi:hypothetical protein Q4551_13730 [Oceanobacter sp. 5_MG-2023]|uniref:capsular polysaccharide export protein, LipB/KpsS family n=1 Tax=Oceanobacter sp. 5_MG-2023 TaxID=3062645 RepID=UPI0026E37E28|nr:hypothetical protein [Oceanobacter sp. 5_MG-2023]MDO6683347.1 hypothetical protein [Oceanobacter sp. 5_MG-2023]